MTQPNQPNQFNPLDPASWNSANNPNPRHPENSTPLDFDPTTVRGVHIILRSGADVYFNIIGTLGIGRDKKGRIAAIQATQIEDSPVSLGYLDLREIVAVLIMPPIEFCEHGEPMGDD